MKKDDVYILIHIIFWVFLVYFFVQSIQNMMDWDDVKHPVPEARLLPDTPEPRSGFKACPLATYKKVDDKFKKGLKCTD